MHFISTRSNTIRQTFTEAMSCGLAADGGLFVPETFPKIDLNTFSTPLTYPQFAQQLLQLFIDERSSAELQHICEQAFNFPIPLRSLNQNTFLLELFHGPTLSFKDVGARFLAEYIDTHTQPHPITIMVATSGDTGSAVASAFYQKKNINIIILFPKGQISARQQQQITCWDQNVLALAVNGPFDDCQALVKAAFREAWWQQHLHLSSANSINIGRLLPQITYYAYASMQFYQRHHQAVGFIVPTGNLGNATAGFWAQAMGFPIREIVLATNANKVIPDYLASGLYQPRASISTLANAMDVGHPSNFERLQFLFKTYDAMKQHVRAISAEDTAIRDTIKKVYQQSQPII